MPGRRQFAKNADGVRHFKLVARSGNSELADDPNASQLVLEPYVRPGESKRSGLTHDELLQVPESLQNLGPEVFGLEEQRDPDEPRYRRPSGDDDEFLDDELDGDCYFPKDGYNYEQHLKRCSGKGKGGGVAGVVLEAKPIVRDEIFPVTKEEIDMQPARNDDEAEVLRALQFDEEYAEFDEDDLEEIVPGGAVEGDIVMWGPTATQYQDMPDLALFKANYKNEMFRAGVLDNEDDDADDESDSDEAFGSEMRDKEIAAEDFEKFLAMEYGDDEIGGIEDEEIEGPVAMENVEGVLDEYIQGQVDERELNYSIYEPQKGFKDDGLRTIAETKAIIENFYSHIDIDDEETSSGEGSDDESREKWDCETVLSTMSNLSNRPGKIGKIKVIATAPLKSVKETIAEEGSEEETEDIVELPDVITTRSKNETAEEKRLRKASVKEMRRVCRKMKKDSKNTYKAEEKKMADKAGSGDVRAKARTFKL